MKLGTILILSILLFSCSNDDDSFEVNGKKVQFVVASSIISDSYPVHVFLPENYNTNSKHQLIIALDGDTRFNTIAGIISDKVQSESIPSCILVAIGNNNQRNRDYTPTAYAHGSGGAEKFYQFIKNELIPELESRYSIDPSNNKTLLGHSFGGLFTQYVMAQERASNPFNKFISSGTSYWYDAGVIFEFEESYANSHNDLDVKFYNGMGTLEGGVMLASFAEMNERLNSRNYPNFKHRSELIEKSGHSGSASEIFKKGLDYVFID
ncbi:alpha/beta hydrolase [Zobellia russellii]|uniref:alpha/beta hydrolase n=1 Tax=Zobellia russellii TaxID=248907 RepID=UPI001BFFD5E0|nr:alpha/beta hydrolase-fold protein [Zobellia russellii]MBT9190336.1 alpha/beta hydrolase [Zobellia russellii]